MANVGFLHTDQVFCRKANGRNIDRRVQKPLSPEISLKGLK